MKTDIVYCIKHEELVYDSGGFHLHAENYADKNGEWSTNVDVCDFPEGWSTCPPPAIDQDWIDHVQEPEDEGLWIDPDSQAAENIRHNYSE